VQLAAPCSSRGIRVYPVAADGRTTLRNTGLATADVRVTFNTPSGIAAVLSANDIFPTSGPGQFDSTLGTGVTANNATLNEQRLAAGGVTSPASDPTRLYLGTFRFTGQSAGTVTLAAESPATSGATVLNDFPPNTGISNPIKPGSATLTVSPVPEPGSLLLVGAAAVGAAALWRRVRPARR